MNPFNTLTKGHVAEDLARRYLERHGLRFVAKQFNTKGGELDLVMLDKDTLVFVEVRFRQTFSYGQAEETVTYHKQRKLAFAAKCFLNRYPKWYEHYMRFDVVGITEKHGKMVYNWIDNAFEVRS